MSLMPSQTKQQSFDTQNTAGLPWMGGHGAAVREPQGNCCRHLQRGQQAAAFMKPTVSVQPVVGTQSDHIPFCVCGF